MSIDVEEETETFTQMLKAAVVFLILMYFAWGDVKYWIFWSRVDAEVLSVVENSFDDDFVDVRFRVEYATGQFVDRTNSIPFERSEEIDATVPVHFVSGDATTVSVTDGNHVLWVIVFLCYLVLLAWRFYPIWAEAREAVNGAPRRRRRKR